MLNHPFNKLRLKEDHTIMFMGIQSRIGLIHLSDRAVLFRKAAASVFLFATDFQQSSRTLLALQLDCEVESEQCL